MPVQFRRIIGGIIGPAVPYGDVGPFHAVVELHPYLHHDPCGRRLHWGTTAEAAPILACIPCKAVVDERRVD